MRTHLSLLAASSILLASCGKEAGQVDAQQFNVQNQQTVVLTLPTSKPQLTVTQLTDSRCPTEAQCFWAGQASVNVLLRNGTDSARVTGLYVGAGVGAGKGWHNRDSAAVTLAGKPYWLYLLGVNPYPSLSSNGDKKTATLRLALQ